ncbi:SPOR domain-containing protein, partial [Sphingomonas sp. CCH5-D11]|uniref:SPOR domain-containing protein n=1 Tax=Sphingomonas sp. CCH5-D11 TaxID=1768786 RepID=UPI0018D23D68
VEVLTAAARTPEADAKTRQNLALALALAGRWADARQMAGVDMAPTDADARVLQWAAFAKPAGAADQVAALLGVKPVKDPGQPVALALNNVMPSRVAPAELMAEAPATSLAAEPEPTHVAAVAADVPAGPRIVFAERREVVQSLPAGTQVARSAGVKAPVRLAAVESEGSAKVKQAGKWFVQLGAYDSAAVAKDAWERAQRRYAGFAGETPSGMAFKSFYRLSVGGYSRGEANALCRGYRANGGSCFVRTGAGDQTAAWVKPSRVQFAGR